VKSNCPNTQTNTPDRFSIWTTKAVDNKVVGKYVQIFTSIGLRSAA